MDERIKLYVGLDVHKDSITVAVAEGGLRDAASLVGRVVHDVNRLLKVLAKLGDAASMELAYEAGPTGFGLRRALQARGYRCHVIAPSLVPTQPGKRIKTDRRDALKLAEHLRNNKLTAVWVPDPEDEAIRDLSRPREHAVESRTQARQHLRSFLLSHDQRFTLGKYAWTKTFYRWLSTLSFQAPATQAAFVEYRLAVEAADQRVLRLTESLIGAIEGWRFARVVAALKALRGVNDVAAIGLIAELGDLSRFEHPRKLMGFLGLTPSEESSGDRTHRGSITKAGNAHARRLLTEAAWCYRHRPNIGRAAQVRQQELSEPIRATAWKAQQRLCARFAKLSARGVHPNKACVAVARELSGFVWAIARLSQEHPSSATTTN
jgi:transposase